MRVFSYPAILLALLILLPAARAADTAVKAWEETIAIPAYEAGPNNLMQVRSTIYGTGYSRSGSDRFSGRVPFATC